MEYLWCWHLKWVLFIYGSGVCRYTRYWRTETFQDFEFLHFSHSFISISFFCAFIRLIISCYSEMGHSNYIAQVLLLAPLALTNAAAIKERQLCLRPAVPVTTCQIADLSTANWNAFDIDGHLLGFINQFGVCEYCHTKHPELLRHQLTILPADNFPRFFVQQSRADGFAKFDCSSFDNPGGCVIPAGQSPATGTDCNFEGLEETVCANFNDPKGKKTWAGVNHLCVCTDIHKLDS